MVTIDAVGVFATGVGTRVDKGDGSDEPKCPDKIFKHRGFVMTASSPHAAYADRCSWRCSLVKPKIVKFVNPSALKICTTSRPFIAGMQSSSKITL
jgi:hypothetical protein